MIVSDLPFGAYQQSKEQAFAAAAELMALKRAYGQTRRRRVDGGND